MPPVVKSMVPVPKSACSDVSANITVVEDPELLIKYVVLFFNPPMLVPPPLLYTTGVALAQVIVTEALRCNVICRSANHPYPGQLSSLGQGGLAVDTVTPSSL